MYLDTASQGWSVRQWNTRINTFWKGNTKRQFTSFSTSLYSNVSGAKKWLTLGRTARLQGMNVGWRWRHQFKLKMWAVKLRMSVESGGDKDIKQERKFTKKYTRKNERKIRLESRVIWNRKTHTEDERKLRQRKRKCKARKKEKWNKEKKDV